MIKTNGVHTKNTLFYTLRCKVKSEFHFFFLTTARYEKILDYVLCRHYGAKKCIVCIVFIHSKDNSYHFDIIGKKELTRIIIFFLALLLSLCCLLHLKNSHRGAGCDLGGER